MKQNPMHPSIKAQEYTSQAIHHMFLFRKRSSRVVAIDMEMQSLRDARVDAIEAEMRSLRAELAMTRVVYDGCFKTLMSEKEQVELRLKQVSEELETARASESVVASIMRDMHPADEDQSPLPNAPTLQTLMAGEALFKEALCTLVERNNVECPLKLECITEPVLLDCNHVFESKALHEFWRRSSGVCPQCNFPRGIRFDMGENK
jgi:hypothetical protein